ncbi:MAG: UbiD family decarboxylase [Planctomycetes bacterium]|nr:UbiD family decarboxylase [Planctomycetota bacterium]
MGYPSLRACIADLERHGMLVRIDDEIDPFLEAAEIHRRVYQANGPAIFFTRVKGCRFPMVSNLFGTIERTRFLFRDMLDAVRHLVELKIDPANFWQDPWRYRDVPRTLWFLWPKYVSSGPILDATTTISELPHVVSWPRDGGAFITLPQVYTEDADRPGWRHSNLGMYRVQISGGEYQPDRQVGLHYQIHRGIGVHHSKAIRHGQPLRVSIFVGGPPAMALSAVMPLPEGMSELTFAGALGGQRVQLIEVDPITPADPGKFTLAADADFCITGTIDPTLQLPEGPFGDHLGYYSLAHPFPVLNVERVYHRKDAIWPFTVVGRPPQEDTSFGAIIHELTGPIIPTVVHGIHAVHAVDAAGVHPLLLAIGSERYVPYAPRRRPQELLTCANALFGQGQLSLAKYLLIVAKEDAPDLDIHDIPRFFAHLLERIDFTSDVHFQTSTTIDTLDYSGTGLNEGSKVVLAAVGAPRRVLPTKLPAHFRLPDGFRDARLCMPGVLAVQAPKYVAPQDRRQMEEVEPALARLFEAIGPIDALNTFPLIVLVDDAEFTARTLNNFLWVTFTRSNPAADIGGIGAFTWQKHWGCHGSLVIDARIKPHHAPPLIEDPEVTKRVDALAAPGRPLHGIV